MRNIADVIGTIIFAIGIMAAFVGCLIMIDAAGAIDARVFWIGVVLMVVGWLISRSGKKP